MQKFWREKSGFTLLEVLVSMAIFSIFMAVAISSYTSIIRAQREANDYRDLYAESRTVFDTLVGELRDNVVDYGRLNEGEFLVGPQSELTLISKTGDERTVILHQDQNVILRKGRLLDPEAAFVEDERNFALNSDDVRVSEFKLYVSPAVDPYDPRYVTFDVSQFHPKVTIFARFEKEVGRETISMDLQTSVSSRIYNQIYPTGDAF